MRRVAVIGLGVSGYRALTPDLSYRELVYQAAQRAYADAGVDPRQDVDGFLTAAEDFHEGTSIFDEYTPDQLGAVQRPMHTVTQDGLHALISGAMTIQTGQFDCVVVEAHSKASNILTKSHIQAYALDPVWHRPLHVHPLFLAGLEMSRYLHDSGAAREAVAEVAARARRQALHNPLAAYGERLEAEDVLASPVVADPLRGAEVATPADGAIVVVLASEERARDGDGRPVWLRGIGWANGHFAPERRATGRAEYAEAAARKAYQQAGISRPTREIELFEVDDSYAYKLPQHLEAIGVAEFGTAAQALGQGNGLGARVNPSGGALGMGHLLEATGLALAAEVISQLRGQAGRRQVDAATGLALAWRGVPTSSGACVIFGREP